MNKKKRMYNQVVFTVTMVFVVCCFMSTSLWAAKQIDIYPANAGGFIGQLNQNGAEIGPVFGLSADEGFQLLRQRTDFNGVTHYRYQQTFKGIPVWGAQVIVSKGDGNKVKTLNGSFIQGITGDVGGIPASLDPKGALIQMQDLHKRKDAGAVWHFSNEQYGTFVYFHKKSQKARLCCVVSFFADTDCGNPSQPVFFIDAKNGKIIDSFDSLTYAFDGTGPGGNLKIGYYYYGIDFTPFGVAEAGSTCTMNWADCKTVDLNHGTSGTTPYSYTCYENTHENINGGFCPLNDAQAFGQAIYDMYNDWYGFPPSPTQLTLNCHYSTNYENIFRVGSTIYMGDGYTTFYPLVALDLIGHEVGHIFTDLHSGLYSNLQAVAIYEAFSDMAGEAAEYYMRGINDFMFGYDVVKAPGQAVRYLYDPPLDGNSIDHVGDYDEKKDVHFTCGIFNKVFYLIATSSGWNTKMAFDIFLKANMDYWTPNSTFVTAAEGVLYAAWDYGYSCQDVIDAFAQVGIPLEYPEPPVADFSVSIIECCAFFTDLSANNPTSYSWSFPGGTPSGSSAQNPTVCYDTSGTYPVTLTVTNPLGSDSKTSYINVCCYCELSGDSQDYEYIAGVAVGDLNNSSGPSGYSDFTSMTAHLSVGSTVNVSLTPGFTGRSRIECWKIWIDYNIDGDFEDPGEEVFSGSGGSTVTGDFTVPASASGSTRMRVVMSETCEFPGCGTFPLGEVEDYTVDFVELDFIANETVLCDSGCVTFVIDYTGGLIGSISWIFEGGTPPSSTAQYPTVCYNTPGAYDVTLIVSTPGGIITKTKNDYITVLPADEIALAVDYVDPCQVFVKSGDADWYRVTDVYFYDIDAARSGDIDNDQSTTIETTVTLDSSGTAKFYWKVSSEANCDYLRFYIDGVEKTRISGATNWSQLIYNLTAGTHTLKWSYTKDGSVSSGSDCGWVDKLEVQ